MSNLERVVVLGSRGFVGSQVLARLKADGINCLGLSREDVDLTQPTAAEKLATTLKSTDTLIFVSALTPDRGRDLSTLQKNLEMVVQFEQAITKVVPQHVIYISSDAVYDNSLAVINEKTPLGPKSFHGSMHLTRELQLETLAKKFGFKLGVLRPCAVYGPGDTHSSYGPNGFVKQAQKNREIALFGEGEELRDHLYIKDFVDVVSHCLHTRFTGVLNVASGHAISFMQVAQTVAKTYGESIHIKTSPRNNPVTHSHFDITQLIATYPKYCPTDLNIGIKTMLS